MSVYFMRVVLIDSNRPLFKSPVGVTTNLTASRLYPARLPAGPTLLVRCLKRSPHVSRTFSSRLYLRIAAHCQTHGIHRSPTSLLACGQLFSFKFPMMSSYMALEHLLFWWYVVYNALHCY